MKKFLLSLAAVALCSSATMAEQVTDVLNAANIGNTGTTYADYTYTGASGAEYALQCAGDKGSIQLRSNNNNSGIVVTKSAGTIVSIAIEWNTETADARVLNVYESATAYTSPSELYANNLSTITTFTKSAGDASYTFTDQPAYIGLRSNSGAMYISSITITWDTDGTSGGDGEDNPPVTPGDGDDVTIVWGDQGYENAQDLTTFTQDGITYSFSAGTNSNAPKYYSTGTAIRLYANNSMTLSVPEGKLMTQIVFTVPSGNPFNAASTANVGTFNVESAVWTSTGAQSVTFTQGGSSGHVRIEKMVITLVDGTGGETPEQPEQPDQPTEAITVAEALAILAGGQTNVTATVKGVISQIDEVNTQFGNATYFIKDALTDEDALEIYRGKWINGESFTSTDQIEVGGTIVVSGTLVNYNGTYEFTTGSTVVSYEGPSGDEPNPPTPDEPSGQNVMFDFTQPSLYGFDVTDVTELDLSGESVKSGKVTIDFESAEGAGTPIRLYSSSGNWALRFYKDTQMTVSVENGLALTGIVFNGTNIGKDWSYSDGTLAGSTWTPSAGKEVTEVTIGKTATGNNPVINTMTVYYDKATGVEAIETEEGEAVYYNLQGVRVNNPERGIFIKVAGNKAEKVVK